VNMANEAGQINVCRSRVQPGCWWETTHMRPRGRVSYCTAGTIALSIAGVVTLSGAVQAAPQSGRDTSWNTVSADVTIRRTHLKADGSLLSAVPSVTYHFEEMDTASGRKTTMTLVAADHPQVRTTAGPVQLNDTYSVMRIEDDGDGSPLRMFDRHGKPIQPPSEESRRRLDELVGSVRSASRPGSRDFAGNERARTAKPGRGIADGLTADPAARGRRRADLERRYGSPKGRVKGLDRFVSMAGSRTIEALVDRDVALPVELNVTENGALVAHTTFSYVQGPANRLVRRTIHTERLMPNSDGARTVADMEFANVRLERRTP